MLGRGLMSTRASIPARRTRWNDVLAMALKFPPDRGCALMTDYSPEPFNVNTRRRTISIKARSTADGGQHFSVFLSTLHWHRSYTQSFNKHIHSRSEPTTSTPSNLNSVKQSNHAYLFRSAVRLWTGGLHHSLQPPSLWTGRHCSTCCCMIHAS